MLQSFLLIQKEIFAIFTGHHADNFIIYLSTRDLTPRKSISVKIFLPDTIDITSICFPILFA